MSIKIRLYTLGCRLNSLESEAIAESFVKNGFEITCAIDADLYIVNTCTVTSKAEQKARRMIRLFSKHAPCLVTGCYSELSCDEINDISPNVIALTNSRKSELMFLAEYLSRTSVSTENIRNFFSSSNARNSQDEYRGKFNFFVKDFSYHSRQLLKVQDGCDRHCAFCRTSVARGEPISLAPDEVVRRIEVLINNGAHEITLTGVNLALYRYKDVKLSDLVQLILPHLNSDVILRFSSLEPDLIDDELLEILTDRHIAGYFHLPIQSASDKVLKMCGRNYNASRLNEIIKCLRTAKKDPFIAADIIAGLVGEEEEDFAMTYDFLQSHELSYLHVFPFSPRPMTRYATSVHPAQRIRDERAGKLRLLSSILYKKYFEKFLCKELDAIAEKRDDEYQYFTTSNYLKIKKPISLYPATKKGDIVKIKISNWKESALI